MFRKIRSAALVLALAVLFVSSAYAAPASRVVSHRAPGIVESVWDWFVAQFLPTVPVAQERTAIHEKAGSQMDPNGYQVPEGMSNAGSSMDPDGYK